MTDNLELLRVKNFNMKRALGIFVFLRRQVKNFVPRAKWSRGQS